MEPDELKEHVLSTLQECAENAPVTVCLNPDRVQDLEEICDALQAELESGSVFMGDCQYSVGTEPGECLVISIRCDSFEMHKKENGSFLQLLRRLDRINFFQPKDSDRLAVHLIIDGLWVEG